MEQILGGTTGLWETADASLHKWSLVNASFYPTRAGGGGIFFPLPNASSGSRSVRGTGGGYTHILNEGSACKNFVLGNFDAATSTFHPAPKAQPRLAIDWGDVVFSEINVIEGRMLHMGWVSRADCLTAPREISYDAGSGSGSGSGGVQPALLSNPIAELLSLRSAEPLSKPPAAMPATLAPGQVCCNLGLACILLSLLLCVVEHGLCGCAHPSVLCGRTCVCGS